MNVTKIASWIGSVAILPFLAGAVPVPLASGNQPVDVGVVRAHNPWVISTNGSWRFQLSRGAIVDGHFTAQSNTCTSSTAQDDCPASAAIDGNMESRWCASGGDLPQWWMVDLGKLEMIGGLQLNWEYSDGHYQYRVEAGPDEAHLKLVSDQTGEPGKADNKLEWNPVSARFLRVTVTDASDSSGEKKWASIREAKVTVIRGGKGEAWSQGPAEQVSAHADDFAATAFNDSAWGEIKVPSNWEVLGYSRPTYYDADSTVGLYRRTVEIPASFSGKKVLWHFDGVTDSAEVWVNGKRVGYHEGGFTAFDMDLTAAILPGRANLLAVRVCKRTPTVDLDTGDYWLLGGIHRDSYLVALPATHVEDLTLVTKLDDKFKDATLETDLKIAGKSGQTVSVVGRIFTGEGKPTEFPTLAASGQVNENGSAMLHLQGAIPAPKLWSAEKPNLYYLVLDLKEGGSVSEIVQQRFGFRQIDIKDGVLLWNGVAIKCTGTCRHEEWASVGHALSEHEWQTDVAMMKAANINAVRTSHYNHAERFLELCDEKGLYILDEVPACFTKPKDLKLMDGFVRNAVETLNRDKNKPCVLAWSCGNESGWGPDFKAMAEYLAANDPTRPRFVSEMSQSTDPVLTIGDHHYPDDNDLRKITTTVRGPSLITEGPHLFYVKPGLVYDYGVNDLWGMALANHWTRVWPSKRVIGAFIWEWQDQGLADKFPDKIGVDENGLRSENHKGLVTGMRVPKPELYHVKMVYSPVTTDDRQVQASGGKWSVNFTNRYAFTDLSELTCKWQAMTTADGDHDLATGTSQASCAPGRTAVLEFPVTPEADALRVSFTNSAGVEIYAVRLHVAGAKWPQPPAAVAVSNLTAEDKADSLSVSSPAFKLRLDRTTGQVTIERNGGRILSGPILNLGEQRIDDGDARNRNDAPWLESKSAPVLSHVLVNGGMTDAGGWSGLVTSDVALAESPDQLLAHLIYTVGVTPEGMLEWSYRLKWLSTDVQAWEFGFKFNVSAAYDQLSWFRRGQWTEYPKDHIGANYGSANRKDVSFGATKRDIVWATVQSPDAGLTIAPIDAALHVRCRSEHESTMLFASSAVSVERSFSWNYCESTRISFHQGKVYDGSLKMWLTAPKKFPLNATAN